MMYLTFFITITLIAYSIYVWASEKKQFVERRLSSALGMNGQRSNLETSVTLDMPVSFSNRFIWPLWKEFKRSFKRRMPGEKEAKIEKLLNQAGNPFGMTPVEYRMMQIALFIFFPIGSVLYSKLLNVAFGTGLLFFLLGLGVAAFLPGFYLKQKIKTRNYFALRELPDVLDLLTVSLEAGLGFDGALSKLVSKKEGVLTGEFHRCLEEMRLGKTRRESLGKIRERLSVDEVSYFISAILQAEKLGIGMVQVLRIQSAEVRDRRKQRAEEAAMKAPVKMLFPLVLFIFPSLFIVLLGPAIIDFVQTFSEMNKK
ncbi:type II secretion system F family protein [Fictibacillus nanhaiensis]|uniref:type II secretion system F family protein n=1 Tax=Fictibacillus nanhaiensis TaxID=742169 RepID=UPI001C9378C1|nr:type II secretion system F family protein [Fictibacillus nanhaiensis]MBY6037445.1 type II secretion system F family protein [Fictibacillus nanhaiensis]